MSCSSSESSLLSEKEKLHYVQQYSFADITCCACRAFIMTVNDYFHLEPKHVLKDDWLCVLCEEKVFFVFNDLLLNVFNWDEVSDA